ncbi:VOC family protein [Microbacterium oryzae]|uniref:VOC family protein n=1 Tax=Microbacterium oryzae TaxID=743009 RepID=A0A6I6DXN2_9MICO|nr:VOC family protein [Microbacterium oryzae]QGU26754.1 VOC family protein [Microbacterium oryzae]
MTAQTLYLWFPGTAAEALTFYRDVFGGELALHTYAEFDRTDGPADAIAHGALSGSVSLYGTDAVAGEETLRMSGVSIALLGTADGATLTRWFHALSDGGIVIDPLQRRSWGAHDGRVVDRHGVSWLIGYEEEATDQTS